MRFFKTIVNRTPKIWFPLAIVLLNGVLSFLKRQYILAYLDFLDLDFLEISPDIHIIGGFLGIATAVINWILLSVLLFFGCRLLCKSDGVFRNFFKIIGVCHLVLLAATLGQFIFILIGLPSDLQEPSKAALAALASVEPPIRLINLVGHICFGVILIAVVQTFFEIRSGQALFITCISYAIYWILSKAVADAFWHLFIFLFGQFIVPSWQPYAPISP